MTVFSVSQSFSPPPPPHASISLRRGCQFGDRCWWCSVRDGYCKPNTKLLPPFASRLIVDYRQIIQRGSRRGSRPQIDQFTARMKEPGYDGLQSLQSLVAQKAEEWREWSQSHIKSLEDALASREARLQFESARFQKLKEDFEYNLELISKRDEELARYELLLDEVKSAEAARSSELSEAKIHADQMRIQVEQARQGKEELRRHYQCRIAEFQKQSENFYAKKTDEVEKERGEFATLKQSLLTQIRDLEDERELSSHQMSMEFQDALQKQSADFKCALVEKEEEVRALQIKAKMLSREIGHLREQAGISEQGKSEVQKEVADLRKQVKHCGWQLQDVEAVKNGRIKELEEKLDEAVEAAKKREEEFFRQRNQLDRACKEKDQCLASLKHAADEREEVIKGELSQARLFASEKESQFRQTLWDVTDKLKERDAEISQLRSVIEEVKEAHVKDVRSSATELVERNVEVQRLSDEKESMSGEIIKLKSDVDRYQKELALALDRERDLQKARSQQEIDWRRRCEAITNDLQGKKEDFIREICRARDEAIALAKQKDAERLELQETAQRLQRERDSALDVLRCKGIPFNSDFLSETEVVAEASDRNGPAASESSLRDQNTQLRKAIQQMRMDLEQMNTQLSSARSGDFSGEAAASKAYIADLEEQVRSLKSANRDLQIRVDEVEKSRTSSQKPPPHPLPEKEVAPVLPKHVPLLGKSAGKSRHFQPRQGRALSERDTSTAVGESTKNKLQIAVQKISELMIEKEQLIRIGNKLRAELLKAKEQIRSHSSAQDHAGEANGVVPSVQSVYGSSPPDLASARFPLPASGHADVPAALEISPAFGAVGSSLRMTSSSEHSSLQEIWGLLDQSAVSFDASISLNKSMDPKHCGNAVPATRALTVAERDVHSSLEGLRVTGASLLRR